MIVLVRHLSQREHTMIPKTVDNEKLFLARFMSIHKISVVHIRDHKISFQAFLYKTVKRLKRLRNPIFINQIFQCRRKLALFVANCFPQSSCSI